MIVITINPPLHHTNGEKVMRGVPMKQGIMFPAKTSTTTTGSIRTNTTLTSVMQGLSVMFVVLMLLVNC